MSQKNSLPLQPPTYDVSKVLVTIPTHDGKIWCDCVGGIAQSIAARRFGSTYFHVQGSCIGHIRNQIAGIFKRQTQFDTLICIDSDIGFSVQDVDYLMEGDEPIATAEYVKKLEQYLPVTFGMGFVRIHRSVFETLDALLDADGKEVVHGYYEHGQLERDYFRTGASSDSRWMAEDFGFWSLVHLAGIKPKIEKRTALRHWGIKSYNYIPPGEFAAQ